MQNTLKLVTPVVLPTVPIFAIQIKKLEDNFSVFGNIVQNLCNDLFKVDLTTEKTKVGNTICEATFTMKEYHKDSWLHFIKLYIKLAEQGYTPLIEYKEISREEIKSMEDTATQILCYCALTNSTLNSLYNEKEDKNGNNCLLNNQEIVPECSDVAYKVLELHPKSRHMSMKDILLWYFITWTIQFEMQKLGLKTSSERMYLEMAKMVIETMRHDGAPLSRSHLDMIIGDKSLTTKILKKLQEANFIREVEEGYIFMSHIRYMLNKDFIGWIKEDSLYRTVANLFRTIYTHRVHALNEYGVHVEYGDIGTQALRLMNKYNMIYREHDADGYLTSRYCISSLWLPYEDKEDR